MNICIEQSTYDDHPLQVSYEPSIVAGCAGSIWIKVGSARVLMNPDEAFDVATRLTNAVNAAKEDAPCAA